MHNRIAETLSCFLCNLNLSGRIIIFKLNQIGKILCTASCFNRKILSCQCFVQLIRQLPIIIRRVINRVGLPVLLIRTCKLERRITGYFCKISIVIIRRRTKYQFCSFQSGRFPYLIQSVGAK